MNIPFIGREKEKEVLQEALQSPEAEMVAVFGRRRVGKTFLIKTAYEGKIQFEVTGIQNAPFEEQMANFMQQLNRAAENTIPIPAPNNWLDAFFLLTTYLEKVETTEKQVVFFDELPWLAARSGPFLRAFGHFWNSWAVNRSIVVVICGSAASWMIEKVVHNTGGLYNRITKRIHLRAFTLLETEQFLKSRNTFPDRYQTIQLYMAMGGVPHHLKEVKAHQSAVQNIDRICFSDTGLLRDEFLQLYPALFANAENHLSVIRALATKQKGLTRQELIASSPLSNGGGLTRVLEELDQSGFISITRPFGKKKKSQLYRLSDEYSLFYLKFIEQNKLEEEQVWQLLSQTASYKSWSGYAFENLCLKHTLSIKKALGIAGVFSTSSSFYQKGTPDQAGTQIDLLIDRNDQVINLCELKFAQGPYVLTKAAAENLRQKISIFQSVTKTKKQIIPTLITTFGITENVHSRSLNVQALDMDALFL